MIYLKQKSLTKFSKEKIFFNLSCFALFLPCREIKMTEQQECTWNYFEGKLEDPQVWGEHSEGLRSFVLRS